MTNEHRACFVVPYYRNVKDDICIVDLMDSAYQTNHVHDLVFIVDNNDVKDRVEKLNEKYYFKKKINVLVIPNPDDLFGTKRNIATIKKWYGLRQLYEQYEYIAAIDCDSLFLKPFDTYDVMKEIWDTKSSFFSNRCSLTTSIYLKNNSYFCNLNDNETLIKATDNFKYSCWFNDIPVYDCSTLKDFFNWLDNTKTSNNLSIYENARNNFSCFDYFIYWFWLICYRGLEFKKVDTMYSGNSVMESVHEDFNVLQTLDFGLNCYDNKINKNIIIDNEKMVMRTILEKEQTLGTHWTSRDYKRTKRAYPNDKLCMQFHVDRLSTFNRATAVEPFWFENK